MEQLSALVSCAQGGDLSAYAEIVRRVQHMACGYAYGVLGDFHLAEDAAQEAFIEAYMALPALRKPPAFPGWFRKIIFKHCDRLTRGKRHRVSPVQDVATLPSNDKAPAEQAETHEIRRRVLQAISALPQTQRTATMLFYIDGYSQKEIADFLEVPVSTVNDRLHASRKRLRERMMAMVKETLEEKAPDERFSEKVIEALLARPRPLDIPGHPVREVWETIRAALPEYEVVKLDLSREDRALRSACKKIVRIALKKGESYGIGWGAHHYREFFGHEMPVRFLAAGSVVSRHGPDRAAVGLRPRITGACVDRAADLKRLVAVLTRVLTAAIGNPEVTWHIDWGTPKARSVETKLAESEVALFRQPLEVKRTLIVWGNLTRGPVFLGAGSMLRPKRLRAMKYDPAEASGFQFLLEPDSIAAVKLGLEGAWKLWQAPYV